jgi:hypothetical protein
MTLVEKPLSVNNFPDINKYQTSDCPLDNIPPSCLDLTCSFDEYVKFKNLKNEAKARLALNNFPYAQKEHLRNIVRTYRHLTETIPNLRILKEFRRALKTAAKQSPQLTLEEISSIFIEKVSSCKILLNFIPFITNRKELDVKDISQYQESCNELAKKVSKSLIEELTSLPPQKPLWNAIKDKYLQTLFDSKECYNSFEGKRIEWLTGSTSASLALMLENSQHSYQSMSLKPLGRLLNENVMPLSGEINDDDSSYLDSGTSDHISEYHLSGVFLSDLEVAEKYAVNFIYELPKAEHLELGIQSILNEFINCLCCTSNPYFKNDDGLLLNVTSTLAIHLKVFILKFLHIYGMSEEKKGQIDEQIKKIISLLPSFCTKAITEKNLVRLYACISKMLPQSLINKLSATKGDVFEEQIDEYFDSHHITLNSFSEEFKTKINPTFTFKTKSPEETLEETSLAMQSVQPLSDSTLNHIKSAFPLIWASITVNSFKDVSKISPDEKPVKGSLDLGKDIQLAFTEEANIDKLRKMLGETDVKVMPLSFAYHMRNMFH